MFCDDVRDLDQSRFERPTRSLRRPTMSTRLAAIDLGAGSFHLAIAEVEAGRKFSVVARHKERVQLGESAFASNHIEPEAFDRGIAAMRRLGDLVRQHAPEAVRAVATSALREAENGREFVRCASAAAGFPIRVIDGLEEARLVHLGTRYGLDLDRRRVAIFDMGGGSTEVIVANDGECEFTASLRLGTLRLRSQWNCTEPPTSNDLARLDNLASECLKPTLAHVRRLGIDFAVLSCGTARTLSQIASADPISIDDPRPQHGRGSYLSLSALRRVERMLSTIRPEDRAELAGTDAKRADTLLPGAVVLRTILERLGVDGALVASTGLREGLMVDYMAERADGAWALQA